jgi:hypothetical protein
MESQRTVKTDCLDSLNDYVNPPKNQPALNPNSLFVSNRKFIGSIQMSLGEGLYFSNIFDFTKHVSQKFNLHLFY